EPLLEVSTDKVDTEIPSPIAGVLEEILVEEDETVEVGAPLARVGDGSGTSGGDAEPAPATQDEAPSAPTDEEEAAAEQVAETEDDAPKAESMPEPVPAAAPAPAAPAAAPAAPAAPASPAAPAAPAAPASSDDSLVGGSGYVTPLVRRLAAKEGVDLSTVTGTGVGGRIRKEDVLQAASAKAPAAAGSSAPATASAGFVPEPVSELRGTSKKMSRLRKVVAERAVESLQNTAQLTSVVEVDVTKVAALRAQVKDEFLAKTGNKLSFLPFFAFAATEALKAYPIINATVEDDTIVYPESENISIAVDTERGLLTPVVRNAGDLDVAGLAGQIADLATRTRDNQLKPDELAGGTFTLTNTGSRGALFDTPVVFLPQSAILGTGIVSKKPAVVKTPEGEAIAIRSTVFLALSYDHRIIDGADAARFLVAVKNRLESGDFRSVLGI
ncbi:2-oxoglutarate dehydrogenase, E2 component, dihydrolipoamide succinyltransferase, partial [Mycetocola reblochoni]